MSRISSIFAIVALGLALCIQAPRTVEATTDGRSGNALRPNILFILTDDQRWDMLAHLQRMGKDGKLHVVRPMPTVEDRIAAEGVTLTSYFDSIGLCCPSRTSILRGQYAQRTRVYFNSGPYGGWSSSASTSATCGTSR